MCKHVCNKTGIDIGAAGLASAAALLRSENGINCHPVAGFPTAPLWPLLTLGVSAQLLGTRSESIERGRAPQLPPSRPRLLAPSLLGSDSVPRRHSPIAPSSTPTRPQFRTPRKKLCSRLHQADLSLLQVAGAWASPREEATRVPRERVKGSLCRAERGLSSAFQSKQQRGLG